MQLSISVILISIYDYRVSLTEPKSSHIRHETEIEPYMGRAESDYLDKYFRSSLREGVNYVKSIA